MRHRTNFEAAAYYHKTGDFFLLASCGNSKIFPALHEMLQNIT